MPPATSSATPPGAGTAAPGGPRARGRRAAAALVAAVVLTGAGFALAPHPSAAVAATTAKPLLGGSSDDWAWYQANIGHVQIHRTYDPGFTATFQQSDARGDPAAGMVSHHSFTLPPAKVAAHAYDAQLQTFVRSCPDNAILTLWKEPEHVIETGGFTAAQFVAAQRVFANIVHAQGGHRRVALVLMNGTVTGLNGRNPNDYWPGRNAAGRNYIDIVGFDVYNSPHGPNVHQGYTDGVNWKTPNQLLDPDVALATRWHTRWMISELGYLEDAHNSTRKAQAITATVAYAEQHSAVAVEYWDSVGRRADWRLRHSSAAVTAWRQAVRSVSG